MANKGAHQMGEIGIAPIGVKGAMALAGPDAEDEVWDPLREEWVL